MKKPQAVEKIDKKAFDGLLKTLLSTKPNERRNIKTGGKRGPRTPIIAKQSSS
jgi:hypothetical protein